MSTDAFEEDAPEVLTASIDGLTGDEVRGEDELRSEDDLRFEARYRWVIYREMRRLWKQHPGATDDNFEVLYEQLRDVVRGETSLDNLEHAQQDQQVVLAARRAVTVMSEMLDSAHSGGTDADGES